MNKIPLWIHVGDWTAEMAIIASNDGETSPEVSNMQTKTNGILLHSITAEEIIWSISYFYSGKFLSTWICIAFYLYSVLRNKM